MNDSPDKWLEDKLKGLDPEVQEMIRQVWECDNLEQVGELVIKWRGE